MSWPGEEDEEGRDPVITEKEMHPFLLLIAVLDQAVVLLPGEGVNREREEVEEERGETREEEERRREGREEETGAHCLLLCSAPHCLLSLSSNTVHHGRLKLSLLLQINLPLLHT